MKIKNLQIKNFQSHKDTTLEFDEGLNIITGPTNMGKSAILRALKKVIRDTPVGNNFVNVDAKECVITVTTEDNEVERRIVVSSKGDTKANEYTLNGDLFAKFGKGVPAEVEQVFRMPEIKFDTIKLDLNFADQLEGPFLLASSPSLKAKVLGKLTGVDVLDRAIVQSNKCVRRLTGEVKSDTESIERLNQELLEFVDIPKYEKELKALSQDLDKVEQDLLLLEKLQNLKINLDDVVRKGKAVRKDLEKLEIIDTINLDKVEETFALFQKVKDLNEQTTNFDVKEKALQTEIKCFQTLISQIDFGSIESDLKCLEKLYDFEKQLVIFEKVKKCEKDIKEVNVSVNNKTKELKMFLKDLKICPTCNQELSDTVIEKMI